MVIDFISYFIAPIFLFWGAYQAKNSKKEEWATYKGYWIYFLIIGIAILFIGFYKHLM